MITNVYRSACEVTVIVVRFWWDWNFLDRFFEKYSNFMKIRPVFHAHGRTDEQTDRRSQQSLFQISSTRLQICRCVWLLCTEIL